jgi:hypothetical protein
MMKFLTLAAVLSACSQTAFAAPPPHRPATKSVSRPHSAVARPMPAPVATKPAEPAWGSRIYLQSDKAVQYRVAKVGQEGDTVLLKSQFRVEPDYKIACYSDRCEGYVVYLAVIDPDARSTMAYHHLFFPRGTKAMWTLPETQKFTPQPTDWGRLYLDHQNMPSLAHTNTPDEHTRIRIFDTSCADDKITGVATRCSDYDASKAETIGG